MPTVILLDVSLSMCRSSTKASDINNLDVTRIKNSVELRQLANVGIGVLLDYFAQNAQLEYTALVVFSSLWEMRHNFTRNHEAIKNGICELELYDKSNIVNALRGLLNLKLEEWTQNGPMNIILVTDGQYYQRSRRCCSRSTSRSASNKQSDDELDDINIEEFNDQFNIPCKLQVVCLASPRDPALRYSLNFFKNLVSIVDKATSNCPVLTSGNLKNFKQSAIWLPDSSTLDISIRSVENLFLSLAEAHYKPYHTILSYGHLSSVILLSPKPNDCLVKPLKNNFDALKSEDSRDGDYKETFVSTLDKVRLFKLNGEINICGFMAMSDIANPALVSRHLVMPVPSTKFNEISKAQQILSQDPNAYSQSSQTSGVATGATTRNNKSDSMDSVKITKQPISNNTNDSNHDLDITKQPTFCVLLHNCLKQENMGAICIVGVHEDANENWFGILHSHIDSRKKSGMMLSLLLPGSQPILWLPNLKSLGSTQLNSEAQATIMDRVTAGRETVKSYSSNSVIWLDPESVQADVQKIVRYARRGPDKAPQFYKELNRIRRAALSYGFFDVLSGLAQILEKEKRLMVSDQNRPAIQLMFKHIDHVIACLRSKMTEDSYDINILPPD